MHPPPRQSSSLPVNPDFPSDAPRHVHASLSLRVPPGKRMKAAVASVKLPLSIDALPHAAVVVVDAGDDVAAANAFVAELIPRAMDLKEPSGPAEGKLARAKLLLGVLAVGKGDSWGHDDVRDHVGLPSPLGDDKLFRPKQTCDVGRVDERVAKLYSERLSENDSAADEGLVPVGIVSWACAGVARVDALQVFDGRKQGGEGQLLLSQMLAEVLAKVGVLLKYGA
jgi:hypothetical protein